MLAALIIKEIVTAVLDLRFVIASLLFLVLIPLGMYASLKDYEQRLANYQQEHQMYRQKYGEEVSSNVEVQGFRPPAMPRPFAGYSARSAPMEFHKHDQEVHSPGQNRHRRR